VGHRGKESASHEYGTNESRTTSGSWGATYSARGGISTTLAPQGNKWVNAVKVARDDRKFALARLCAVALASCRRGTDKAYMRALMLNYAISSIEGQYGVAFGSAAKAARLGNAAAMACLGGLYRRGLGTPRDYGQGDAVVPQGCGGGQRVGDVRHRRALPIRPWRTAGLRQGN